MIKNPLLPMSSDPFGTTFVANIVPALVGLALVVGVVIFFFIFIMGAIQWISSGGDKQGLETARGKISSAIVGLVILFSVFAIIKLIEAFFKITIMTLDISPLIIQ
jgi:hypothetical protein